MINQRCRDQIVSKCSAVLGTCLSESADFVFARQTNSRSDLMSTIKSPYLTTKKLASRLSGARNPFSAFQLIQFFRGTTVAENEILRRDELERVYLSKWKKAK
jgi:hypothetical protein